MARGDGSGRRGIGPRGAPRRRGSRVSIRRTPPASGVDKALLGDAEEPHSVTWFRRRAPDRHFVLGDRPTRRQIPQRRAWDSNPRCRCRHSGFQDRRTRPLCEPSPRSNEAGPRGAFYGDPPTAQIRLVNGSRAIHPRGSGVACLRGSGVARLPGSRVAHPRPQMSSLVSGATPAERAIGFHVARNESLAVVALRLAPTSSGACVREHSAPSWARRR